MHNEYTLFSFSNLSETIIITLITLCIAIYMYTAGAEDVQVVKHYSGYS